jgi:hypothetical protein
MAPVRPDSAHYVTEVVMTGVVDPVALIAVLAVLAPGTVLAQTTGLSPSNPEKSWNLDFSGSVGISPGIGIATTGLGVSGAITFARTTELGEFAHRCWGFTAMVTTDRARSTPEAANFREVAVFAVPRWDYGDTDGTGFVRLFGGARQLSQREPTPQGRAAASKTTFALGAGMGVEVLRVLLDVNWVMSPWEKLSPYRLTVSAGYMWSFRLGRGQ